MYRSIFIFSLLLLNNSFAQVKGCTDVLGNNYNSDATINDGSCLYDPVSISPLSSVNLSNILLETSGLVAWSQNIWTHNDNTDNNLYTIDSSTGSIIKSYTLKNTINKDWEEISQDKDYLYIGDFGNNANGNRTDLKILRIDKQSLIINNPKIDTINFSYANQIDFTPNGSNNTDFDCEAFIVSTDSIFLFSKQWISNKTGLYVLPKIPGTYIAQLKDTLDVQGLITGATYLESQRLIALCGYSSLLQPFVYLLYDFEGHNFFRANKRKIAISLSLHQVEGIATTNGLKYFISNENLSKPPLVNNPQKLHQLDLSDYLNSYLNGVPLNSKDLTLENTEIQTYPNPCRNQVYLENLIGAKTNYKIANNLGKLVLEGILTDQKRYIEIEGLPPGWYHIKLEDKKTPELRFLKY